MPYDDVSEKDKKKIPVGVTQENFRQEELTVSTHTWMDIVLCTGGGCGSRSTSIIIPSPVLITECFQLYN